MPRFFGGFQPQIHLTAVERTAGLHFTTLVPGLVSLCNPWRAGDPAIARDAAAGILARAMLNRPVNAMKDLLFTLITIGFFAGAWLYTKACEKL